MQTLARSTAEWLAEIGSELREKLERVGLVEPIASRKLNDFLDAYIQSRKNDTHTKGATLITIRRVSTDLATVLGSSTNLRNVSVEDAERFKQFYQDKELAGATIYRRLKMAKMLFKHAMKLKYISENPFADVQGKNSNPSERRYYISEEVTKKIIEVANPVWRTIIALARLGGLRCPSEVLSLKWENVDLPNGRMTVSSPKTEHLEGRAYRVVPIFARLRPYLEDAYELAAKGEVYVVGGQQGQRYRQTSKGKAAG